MKKKRDHLGFLSSLFAIIVGLIVGFIILLVSNPSQAAAGFATIITGPVTHGMKGMGQVFYYATPIILTGLSVGFAFKTGLFNIGASGQFIVGGFAAVYVGIKGGSLGGAQWIVALLAALIAGMIWGAVPGIFKAFFNVNEVISCIMMNYIGMYMVNFLVSTNTSLYDKIRNYSKDVVKTANVPGMGLDKLFEGSSINGGFFISLIAVVVIYILLEKTTFGYELKAAGFNPDASKYAGMNDCCTWQVPESTSSLRMPLHQKDLPVFLLHCSDYPTRSACFWQVFLLRISQQVDFTSSCSISQLRLLILLLQ